MVESYQKGEEVKKANIFTREEILKFIKTADEKNRYWFSRKIVAILAYLGGTRLKEMRGLTRDCVQPCPEGFYVTFIPAKQQFHVKRSK